VTEKAEFPARSIYLRIVRVSIYLNIYFRIFGTPDDAIILRNMLSLLFHCYFNMFHLVPSPLQLVQGNIPICTPDDALESVSFKNCDYHPSTPSLILKHSLLSRIQEARPLIILIKEFWVVNCQKEGGRG
jgi:hypothetical protein